VASRVDGNDRKGMGVVLEHPVACRPARTAHHDVRWSSPNLVGLGLERDGA